MEQYTKKNVLKTHPCYNQEWVIVFYFPVVIRKLILQVPVPQ